MRPYQILNETTAGHCHLSLEFSHSSASWCILDLYEKTYLALSTFTSREEIVSANPAAILNPLLDSSPPLRWNFRSVSASLVSLQSTLVPDPLYDRQMAGKYIGFNSNPKEKYSPSCDILKQHGINNVYMADSGFTGALKKNFPSVNVHHHSTALISAIFRFFGNIPGKNLYLHFDPVLFQLSLFNGKSLIFFNSFQFQRPEDVVYYSLFTCEQMEMDPSAIPVILLGAVEADSEIYDFLQRYFKKISLGIFEPAYSFSPALGSVNPHRYFRILNQYPALYP